MEIFVSQPQDSCLLQYMKQQEEGIVHTIVDRYGCCTIVLREDSIDGYRSPKLEDNR